MSRKSKDKKAPEKQDRRNFLQRLSALLGFLAIAEFLSIGLAFFNSKPRKALARENDHYFIAGNTEDFPPGSVTPFAGARFFLVRLKDGGFMALSLRCSHLGCAINWHNKQDRFICPCHASQFDKTGNVLSAPAPRALDYYPLEINANVIRVNTAKVIKRNAFNSSQVVYG
jgi:cytochrome b6-f complex iron-sulfur subunit